METGGGSTLDVELTPPSGNEPWETLRAAGRDLVGSTRIVVVRGAVGAFAHAPSSTADAAELAFRDQAVAWLRRPDLVSIAAIRGPVRGDALGLCLACDLRLCATDTDFVLDGGAAHRLPAAGALGRLEELLGYSRVLELALTARTFSAAEAVAGGLVTLAVPDAEVDAAVADLVAAVLATPRAVAVELKANLSAARSTLHGAQNRRTGAEVDAALRLLADPAASES